MLLDYIKSSIQLLAPLSHVSLLGLLKLNSGLGQDGRGKQMCLSLECLLLPLRAEKMWESLNCDN